MAGICRLTLKITFSGVGECSLNFELYHLRTKMNLTEFTEQNFMGQLFQLLANFGEAGSRLEIRSRGESL